MKNQWKRGALRLVPILCGLILLTVGSAARAADPFYENLFDQGERDYRFGNYAEAARKLEIACFGFLDEPELLARGLVQLGLTQAAAGDDVGFDQTFTRLAEIEDRFAVYGSLPEDDTKRRFEADLVRLIPAEELARVPAFARILPLQKEEELESLSASQLKRRYEQRLAADQYDSQALIGLTRQDIAQGNERRARRRAERLLATDPNHQAARCVRGHISLRARRCGDALEDLESCDVPPADDILSPILLECLVQRGDAEAALAYVRQLPESLQIHPEIAASAVRLGQEGEPGTQEDRAQAAGTRGLSPEEIEQIQRIRQDLVTASSLEELEAALAGSRELADRHPSNRELQLLAAEVAYRCSKWSEAVELFEQAGRPDDKPLLLFYMAVSLFENGNQEGAAEVLRMALPGLQRSPFVDGYARRILGNAESPSR